MKYYGRVALTSISLLTTLGEYLMDFNKGKADFVLSIIFAIFAWYVGSLYDKYKSLALHDPLTEIYNRRYVYKSFPKLILKAALKNENSSLFLIDVNNFKALNDGFGHTSGDEALKRLTNLLVKNTRKTDIVARWGGDEFLIIIPKADQINSKKFIQQLNKAVEVEIRNSKYPIADMNLGISIGYASFPDDGSNSDELLSVADQKMYKYKSISKSF